MEGPGLQPSIGPDQILRLGFIKPVVDIMVQTLLLTPA